ncbi:MAG: TolB family protein [Anaerolineae bacterium]
MQLSNRAWFGIIAILTLLLVIALALLLTGNFPSLISLEPTSTPAPPPTNTPTPAPSRTPTNTPPPADTATPTPSPEPTGRAPAASPTPVPTPLPPFPTPQAAPEVGQRPLRIAYMSRPGADWEIIVAEADGSNPQNFSNDPGFDAFPVWSPQGEKLAWISDRFGAGEDPGVDVLVADLDGGNLVNLSNAPETNDFSASWSPNGQLVAFISTRFGDGEVFVATLDGVAYNLSEHEATDVFFDWAPACADPAAGDGWGACRVLIGSSRGSQAQALNLFALSPDGVDFEFVSELDLNVAEAVYSPDGAQIAYVKEDEETGALDLFVLDLDSQNETRLTSDEAAETSIAWSPAGGLIAYISDVDGDNDIYAVSVPEAEITNLTDSPFQEGLNGDFAWSPDGSQILFSTDRDGSVEIYVMDADGGNPTNLTNSPEPDIEAIWLR